MYIYIVYTYIYIYMYVYMYIDEYLYTYLYQIISYHIISYHIRSHRYIYMSYIYIYIYKHIGLHARDLGPPRLRPDHQRQHRTRPRSLATASLGRSEGLTLWYQGRIIPLRVQIAHIRSMYGFSIRNRNYGLGYMLHIWVLEPLGFMFLLSVVNLFHCHG